MSFQSTGPDGLDYYPCRYGKSKLIFRGPRRRLEGDYVVYLGGIETFGKFIPLPFPAELEIRTGVKSVNLGCPNIGVDSYLREPTLIAFARRARLAVIEIVGAQNVSNAFYAVHPRRNDRFIRASGALKDLFPDVDFTEFSFTRHLLHSLKLRDPTKFDEIVGELKRAWTRRMTELVTQFERPVVLLWFHTETPEATWAGEPLFIEQGMVEDLPNVRDIVRIEPQAEERQAGLLEMMYSSLDHAVAAQMMGPVVQRRATDRLADIIKSTT